MTGQYKVESFYHRSAEGQVQEALGHGPDEVVGPPRAGPREVVRLQTPDHHPRQALAPGVLTLGVCRAV